MDLNYIKKINGTYGKSCKQSLIDEMLNQYEEADKNIITEFDVLINSNKAKSVFINDTPSRVLLEYKNTKNSSSSDFIWEIRNYQNTIKQGDYIKYLNPITEDEEFYICTSKAMNKRSYDINYANHCNQMIHVDAMIKIPCVCSDDSYGSKTSLDNDYISFIDNKLKVEMQYNDITRKIMPNFRFILNHSETDVYRILDRKTGTEEGMIIWICKKDVYRKGYDDLENNIAYNGTVDDITPANYKIEGEDEIKVGRPSQYILSPKNGAVEWSLDEYSQDYAQIKIIDDYTIEVTGLQNGELIELKCIVDSAIELIKEILVVK